MSARPMAYVLDSYALLAYLGGEAGQARVAEILSAASRPTSRVLSSMISLGEVLYITERVYGLPRAQEVLAALEQLPLEILPASREAVLAAAHVKAHYAISYADAFVVAAAQEWGAVAVTGDPEFRAVEALIKVEWLARSA
jgi:predicted nucleic acid-binding protein